MIDHEANETLLALLEIEKEGEAAILEIAQDEERLAKIEAFSNLPPEEIRVRLRTHFDRICKMIKKRES